MNRRYFLAVASALTLAGCGGGGTPSTNPTPPPAAYTATLLHESAMPGSKATAVSADGTVQGGEILTGISGQDRATIWRGTPASAVELHRANSQVTGVDGDVQVGYAGLSGNSSALLWRGSPGSEVNLHPSGFTGSMAHAVSGSVQAGEGTLASGKHHALLWRGTAASVVDLHPAGFDISNAYGVGGDTQVGDASTSDFLHSRAMLWRGTAASAIDLHPSGFRGSFAHGVRGGQQVGYATTSDGNSHATVWSGTAASASDLHAALAGLTLGGAPLNLTSSVANGIDANGNIVGEGTITVTVGGAESIKYYAILWKKNP